MTVDDLLFRGSPDPAWIFDRQTLGFLSVNPAAVATYGYSEQEFLAMTIADIRPAQDVPALKAFLASDNGLGTAGRWTHRWKSGELRTVEVRSSPVTYRGRDAELVAIRDVTELVTAFERTSRALDAEREARANLEIAGRVARFGAWSLDTITGEVVWSGATAAIHDEPAGVSRRVDQAAEYYVPEHRPLITAAVERCISTAEPFDLTLQIITAKGRRCWVRAVGEPVRGANGRVVTVRGAFQDVDDLEIARERLVANERRLGGILEGVNEGFLVLSRDWNIVFANSAAARLVSRAIDELVGNSFWKVFPGAVETSFPAHYQRALDTGETVVVEDYFEPLKAWFEVRAYPSEVGLTLNFRDVTERKAALSELLSSEERFRLIAEVTNDVIWDWEMETDRIRFSDSFSKLFGHETAGDWSAATWVAHIHVEDRARVLEHLEHCLASGAREWRDGYRLERFDHSMARVIDRGVIIRDPDGRARRMLGALSDITERFEIEAQLREAQKLEAMGRLTGGVAHDFNNLLTVIIGASESLQDVAGDLPEAAKLTDTIAAAAARGADLTSHMLAFARRQPLEPRATDIGGALDKMTGMLGRILREDINLTVVSEPRVWRGMVDPSQLDSAILNLAINARDAMPDGGSLTIKVENVRLHAEQPGGGRGDYVVVSVSDTGIGMDADTVSQAFEPFFTTKEVGSGSGLGLSMVYGFARQSRGHVKIYSQPGQGTTVRLYVPRAANSATAVQPRPATKVLPRGAERILVVEDDPMVREHVARQLAALGYEVTLSANGAEALQVLSSGAAFDLLFTDIVMPGGINGRELAEAAARIAPDLRILFTSGYPEDGIVSQGGLSRGVRLLSKPYRRADLAAKVRDILDDAEGK